jgi:transmembrane sensor
MEKDRYELNLIVKELCGEISHEDRLKLDEWLKKDPANRYLYDEVNDPEQFWENLARHDYFKSQSEPMYRQIMEALNEDEEPIDRQIAEEADQHKDEAPIVVPWYRYVAAACLVAIVLVAIVLFWENPVTINDRRVPKTHYEPIASDVQPGRQKAVLTLADNVTIAVDKSLSGKLAGQGNVDIYNNNGKVIYKAKVPIVNSVKVLYNKLSTANGQTYPLELSDGSKVWLNAASSIKYPVAFTGNERSVHVTGEAYFEVAPIELRSGQKMPFTVHVGDTSGNGIKETVEVLGTQFNINAYNNEGDIKTTLLEGSVKITPAILTAPAHTWQANYCEGVNAPPEACSYPSQRAVVLRPGQQAITANNTDSLVIKNVIDTEKVVAWKNGFFQFKDDDLQTVMRQVARWYDLEVVYMGQIPDDKFSGKIERNENLSQVLKILEKTSNLEFIIENKTITIKSKK